MINSVLKELNFALQNQKSIKDIADKVYELRNSITNEHEYSAFVNYVRNIVQMEALKAVENNGGKGLIAMATGSGKTKVAVDLMTKYSSPLSENSLIVPTEKLRDEGWKEEVEKWSKGLPMWDTITSLCYASASKPLGKKYRITVLDEAHNITELSSEFFANNTSELIIGLTATPPDDPIKQKLLEEIGLKLVYTLTLDQAVKLGFVAPYKITVVSVPMEDTKKEIPGGTKDKPFMTTEVSQMQYLNKLVQSAMFDKTPSGKKRFQFAILKRMRAVYNLPSKERAAQFLLDKVIPKEDRTLIFAGGIEQSERLCENFFHSKSGDKAYNAFKEESINRLSCVQSINEGHNFEGIDGALIVQLNSKEKDLIQRLGRLIRYRAGHEAHVFILVSEGTQDMKWLESAMTNIDKVNVEYTSFLNFKNKY